MPLVRQCTVYQGRGVADESALELEPIDLPCGKTADRVSIRIVMSRGVVCARPDLDVGAVIELMMKHRIGCLPIVDERRRPIGMITKFDVVEQLDASMRAVHAGTSLPPDLAVRTADDVMMPLALALDEHATVAHAAAMMASEDTHHVLVVDHEGRLLGVVSSKDIVNWLVDNEIVPLRHLPRDTEPLGAAWRPLEG